MRTPVGWGLALLLALTSAQVILDGVDEDSTTSGGRTSSGGGTDPNEPQKSDGGWDGPTLASELLDSLDVLDPLDESMHEDQGDDPVAEDGALDCSFDKKCCWADEKTPVDQMRWLGVETKVEEFPELLAKLFGTDETPDGMGMVTMSALGEKEDYRAVYSSCPVKCTTDEVKVAVKHWATEDVKLEVCQMVDGEVSDCQELPYGDAPGATQVTLPGGKDPFKVAIVASGFDKAGVVLVDDIRVDMTICPETTTAEPTSSTTSSATTAPTTEDATEPTTEPSTTEPPPPVSPAFCEAIQCNFDEGNACNLADSSKGKPGDSFMPTQTRKRIAAMRYAIQHNVAHQKIVKMRSKPGYEKRQKLWKSVLRQRRIQAAKRRRAIIAKRRRRGGKKRRSSATASRRSAKSARAHARAKARKARKLLAKKKKRARKSCRKTKTCKKKTRARKGKKKNKKRKKKAKKGKKRKHRTKRQAPPQSVVTSGEIGIALSTLKREKATTTFEFQEGKFGNWVTGIVESDPESPESPKYAGAYLMPEMSAVLYTKATDIEFPQALETYFRYYEATAEITFMACCDNLNVCPFISKMQPLNDTADERGVFDKRFWRTGNVQCKKGTKRVLFYCLNAGKDTQGACGVDSIGLYYPFNGQINPDDHFGFPACADTPGAPAPPPPPPPDDEDDLPPDDEEALEEEPDDPDDELDDLEDEDEEDPEDEEPPDEEDPEEEEPDEDGDLDEPFPDDEDFTDEDLDDLDNLDDMTDEELAALDAELADLLEEEAALGDEDLYPEEKKRRRARALARRARLRAVRRARRRRAVKARKARIARLRRARKARNKKNKKKARRNRKSKKN